MTDLTNGILNILQWSTHDFWRLLASILILRALFSWRIFSLTIKKKTKNYKNEDKKSPTTKQ